MKRKKSFVIFLLALLLAPFAPSIRALSKKIDEKLAIEYAKVASTTSSSPGFPLAAAPQSIGTVMQPLVMTKETSTQPVQSTPVARLPNSPGRLVIPSINLNIAIGSVGLTPAGNMGVLNDPKSVGWYNGGVVPGAKGSAVIDAHVFQAFAKLKNVKLGNSIYVDREDGSKLHFVVSEIEVYPYTATEPLSKIFNRSDRARLNLITCYGKLTANHSTYDHRLVVFAELVG